MWRGVPIPCDPLRYGSRSLAIWLSVLMGSAAQNLVVSRGRSRERRLLGRLLIPLC